MFKTEDMFLSFIDRVLDPSVDHLALNFAYPMTPLSRDGYLDGTLVSGSKEHAFDGLVGHAVGDSIERYIKDKQKTHDSCRAGQRHRVFTPVRAYAISKK